MIILIIFITIIVAIYLTILWMANDFSLPTLNLEKYRKQDKPLSILATFPHPDDETMNVAGLLSNYARRPNTKVFLLTTTKGEKGETNGICAQNQLAQTRMQELKEAMKPVGLSELIIWDYPDGDLANHIDQLSRDVDQELTRLNPDVVITYDASGLYGHPDHIVLHHIVHNMLKRHSFKLLCATLPAKILKKLKLPTTITLGDKVVPLDEQLEQSAPKYRFGAWRFRNIKLHAIRAHRSQNIAKHLPIPLWLYSLVSWNEYFSEENNY